MKRGITVSQEWTDYCVQTLQTDMVADALTWGIVLVFFGVLLAAFCFFKPLKRFKGKAVVVLPLIACAFLLLALIEIVPKMIDVQSRSFITVENAAVQRYTTHQMPFDSRYIDVLTDEGERVVRLEHLTRIPTDAEYDTVYHGTVIYAKHSKTLVYADVK